MPPPKKPRCRDAPWFFLAREGLSARPEWARNRRWTMPRNVSVRGAFQLTPSARRATVPPINPPPSGGISIHALREEGDSLLLVIRYSAPFISIHALREEGDTSETELAKNLQDFNPRPPRGGRPTQSCETRNTVQFQSTPSARRATRHPRRFFHLTHISIHALRKEGDKSRWTL